MKKKKASVEYLSSLMLICLLGLLLLFCQKIKSVKLCQFKLRDGVDTSLLAAAVIDKELFEENEKIQIKNLYNSRKIFEDTLKYNLGLNDEMMPDEKEEYEKITIHNFIVYRISDDNYLYKYNIHSTKSFSVSRVQYDHTQTTSNGKLIEGETIYADIGTYVKGFNGEKKYERIKSCVDVISSEEGEDCT